MAYVWLVHFAVLARSAVPPTPRAGLRHSVAPRSAVRALSTADIEFTLSDTERSAGVLSNDTVERAHAAFRSAGFVVLRGALPLDVVAGCAVTAAENLEKCRVQLKKQGVAQMDAQGFAFHEICHRSKGRFDMQLRPGIAPVPIVEPRVELQAPWMPLVRALLGPSAKHLFTGCVVSNPGSEAQNPHLDGGHLFGLDGADALMCPPHCLNVFVPLVTVTAANGPTQFWPGTHQLGKHNERGGPGLSPELALGDVAVFDYRVVHRGLPNQSEAARPVLYVTYSMAWFADVQNFPETPLFPKKAASEAKGFAGSSKKQGK
jgi:ectoine hydroxylase-related dioxygenase (phytanoyl-CoA dioxygenase family)